ncbi:hypothetical protein CPB83DRAFT_837418 [Crepidotus variabilis]|uniref:Uncharacterized protein n=1 Tax=Crepidotus variabilis TaxID=179855 RepID=A0A9P6JN75_9AGAR|nr:hypothetical protein CPB83DRAFT_837418 [Crepidotus variabilis]
MNSNDRNTLKHTEPIAIPNSRGRARSMSVSSNSSSASSGGPPTPPSATAGRITIPSPSTSPILSYFIAQSPTKTTGTANTFPFRKFSTGPVFEEEEGEKEPLVAAHARRASASIATKITQTPTGFNPEVHSERASNLLRRLSLGGPALARPQLDTSARMKTPPSPPPNSAASPSSDAPFIVNKPRRSATLSAGAARPRRAPSPMGERILKGHFDGFN